MFMSEKNKQKIRESKYDLINFIESLAIRAQSEEVKMNLIYFSRFLSEMHICYNSKTLEIDQNIKDIMIMYLQYAKANPKINGKYDQNSEINNEYNIKLFTRYDQIIRYMLGMRNKLFNENKIKNALPFFHKKENELQQRRNKQGQLIELHDNELWQIDTVLLEFESKRLKYIYDNKLLKKKRDQFVELGKNNIANRAEYLQEIQHLDIQIADNDRKIKILLDQMTKHEKLKGILRDIDVEKFINNSTYSDKALDEVFFEKAKEAEELTASRIYRDNTIDEITKEYETSLAQNKITAKENKIIIKEWEEADAERALMDKENMEVLDPEDNIIKKKGDNKNA